MRILCIGDSLGLPREECSYESTWFYRLQQAFPQHEFIDFFSRGLVINDALERFDTYYQYYNADVVIIQSGIVDCSPRYINERNSYIKAIIKFLKVIHCIGVFWKLVKMRKRRATCVFTKIFVFSSCYKSLIDKFISSGVSCLILIKIGHCAPSVQVRNPKMNENVDKYNCVIDEIEQQYEKKICVLSPLNHLDDSYYVDGYHCNPKGMEVVYEQIKSILSLIDATKR